MFGEMWKYLDSRLLEMNLPADVTRLPGRLSSVPGRLVLMDVSCRLAMQFVVAAANASDGITNE